MIGCLPTQALTFLAVFVYVTQAIAFGWKPGFSEFARIASRRLLSLIHDELFIRQTIKNVQAASVNFAVAPKEKKTENVWDYMFMFLI